MALLVWLGLCLFSGCVSWLVWFACGLRCCVMLLACLVVVFLLVAGCTLCCGVWRVWLCWLYTEFCLVLLCGVGLVLVFGVALLVV